MADIRVSLSTKRHGLIVDALDVLIERLRSSIEECRPYGIDPEPLQEKLIRLERMQKFSEKALEEGDETSESMSDETRALLAVALKLSAETDRVVAAGLSGKTHVYVIEKIRTIAGDKDKLAGYLAADESLSNDLLDEYGFEGPGEFIAMVL